MRKGSGEGFAKPAFLARPSLGAQPPQSSGGRGLHQNFHRYHLENVVAMWPPLCVSIHLLLDESSMATVYCSSQI